MIAQQGGKGIFSKKQRSLVLAVILVVIISIGLTAAALINQGNKIANEEIEQYLSELSYQTSYKVNQRITINLETLIRLNDQLSLVADEERQLLVESTLKTSAFEEIGYINTDGYFISENQTLDISNTNIMNDILLGNSSVGDRLIEFSDGRKGIFYAIANQSNDHIALAGWIPTDTMLLLMNTDTFEGIGFSHIVSLEGDYILSSQNSNALLNQGENFFKQLETLGTTQNSDDLQNMMTKMGHQESGSLEYEVSGNKRTLTYVPLEITDWYLLSIVPSDAYVYNINQFTNQAIMAVAGISVLLFGALTLSILFVSIRKNKVISEIAYIDPVTEGFTKTRFEQEIKEKLKHYSPFTYVIIDIRKFKLINDLKGSKGGDAVLKHVYNCIQKHLDEDEFAARIQADNFEIIFNTVDKEVVSSRLHNIAEEINDFNKKRETPYYLPIDCGIYCVEHMEEDFVIMRDRANYARKNNKESSQAHLCSCVYYNDLERLQMVMEKEIDNAMEKALENEEFVVYLQPKVNVQTNKVAGAEALIRWNSSTMGFLPPNKFIPYFEKTGFIVKLDQFVFEKVCQQIRKWIDEGVDPVPISVNLSRRDIYSYNYLDTYKEIQERYQVPSHLLEIEFTETLFFENLELLKRTINEVHEAGYQCSIDDFGSGYSSLSLLKEIPVDILKLDKTFFDNIDNTRGDKVVEHVIALAKDLNMITVAEGVETVIQVDRLRNVKCDLIQGYVYYKPMTIDDFNKIVDNEYKLIEI